MVVPAGRMPDYPERSAVVIIRERDAVTYPIWTR
jgi:hypothetical protein